MICKCVNHYKEQGTVPIFVPIPSSPVSLWIAESHLGHVAKCLSLDSLSSYKTILIPNERLLWKGRVKPFLFFFQSLMAHSSWITELATDMLSDNSHNSHNGHNGHAAQQGHFAVAMKRQVQCGDCKLIKTYWSKILLHQKMRMSVTAYKYCCYSEIILV